MIIGEKDWFPKLPRQLTTRHGSLQKADFIETKNQNVACFT
jgi:hypothetical protein